MALAFFGCLDLVLAFMLFVCNGNGETLTKYESITFLINTLSFVYSFPEILKLISEAIKEKDLSDYILHICDVISEMTFLKDRSSGVRFYNIACLLKAMQFYIPYDFKRSSRELVYRMFLGEISPSCLLILAKYAYDCYLWSDSEKECYDLFFCLMKQESIKVFIDCLTPKEREIFDKISKFIGNRMVPASEQELQKIEKFLKVCYKLKCDGIKEGDIDGRNKIVKPEYTQEFIEAHLANKAQKIVEAGEKELDLTLFYVGVLDVLCGIRFDQSYRGFDPSWRSNLMDCIGCKPRSILTQSGMINLIRPEMVQKFGMDLNITISILTNGIKTEDEVKAAIKEFGETPHVVILL